MSRWWKSITKLDELMLEEYKKKDEYKKGG